MGAKDCGQKTGNSNSSRAILLEMVLSRGGKTRKIQFFAKISTFTGTHCSLLYYLCTRFQKLTIMKNIFTTIGWLMLFVLFVLAIAMSSCNVTRTITTQSQYYQKGDTTCTIVTKTIETYDASKKTNY